jgi:hypothetical protein
MFVQVPVGELMVKKNKKNDARTSVFFIYNAGQKKDFSKIFQQKECFWKNIIRIIIKNKLSLFC